MEQSLLNVYLGHVEVRKHPAWIVYLEYSIQKACLPWAHKPFQTFQLCADKRHVTKAKHVNECCAQE